MNYMILDPRTDKNIIYEAEKLGFKVVEADFIEGIDFSVAGHTDMQLTKVGKNTLIVNPASMEHYKKSLKGIDLIFGKTMVQGKYPEYTAYNIALTEKIAIHNFKYTDPVILEKMGDRYKKVQVKQGYSKCSVVTLPDGIITSDEGVAKKTLETGLDTLLIQPGNINLSGKEYGFIGGTCGYFGGKLYFAGNPENLSDFNKVQEFLEKRCIEIICLSNDKLADIGSIIIV